MKALRDKLGSQDGAIWTLTLVVLAMGSLMVGPAVAQISSGLASTNKLDQRVLDRYASDAAVEHALWRLQYESGFQASLNPTATYTQSFNQRTADITVTAALPPNPPQPPPPQQQSGDHLSISSRVEPNSTTPGQSTTVTYTLSIDNYGTSTIPLKEIGDLLPQGFSYVSGSATSSSITFQSGSLGEPELGTQGSQQELKWEFNPTWPSVAGGVRATVSFQATATPSATGAFGNQAEVEAVPGNVGTVSTGGSASPVIVQWPQFDITAVGGSFNLRVRAEKPPTGVVIRSWQVQ